MALIVRNSHRILLQKTHKSKVHVLSYGDSHRSMMLSSTAKVGQEALWKASAAVSSPAWLQSLYKERTDVTAHLVNTTHLKDHKSQNSKKAGSRLGGNPTPVELVLRLKQSSLPNWSSSSVLSIPNHWNLSTDKHLPAPAKVSSNATCEQYCDTDSIGKSPVTDEYSSSSINTSDFSITLGSQFVQGSKFDSSNTVLFSGSGGGIDGGNSSGKYGDSSFVFCDGSGGSKDGDTPEDRNGPTSTQLKDLEFYIQDKMPKFFHEPHPYSIYVPDIEFHNNIAQKPYKTKGLLPYVWALTKLRFFAHMNYVRVEMKILKTTIDEDMGIVQVRWQVYGVPQSMAIKFWKVFKDKNEVVIDGFSTLTVNKDGKIWKHVADNVMPDQERKRRRMTFVERLRERWRLRPVTGLNATAKK